MDKGVYCLLFRNTRCRVNVGALGMLSFQKGWHVYTGSAQGPGGLTRVIRHIRVNRKGIPSPHWHIDYLLIHHGFNLVSVACAPTQHSSDECLLSGFLTSSPIEGFGCSDCSCRSHLGYFLNNPENEVASAFMQVGLCVTITTLNST